jgi:hypothetical protein
MTGLSGGAPGDLSRRGESRAVYEIRLQGGSAAHLRRQFPTARVVTTRTETVLRREIEAPAELDDLVAQLLALGLTLVEVQQFAVPPPTAPPQGGTSP